VTRKKRGFRIRFICNLEGGPRAASPVIAQATDGSKDETRKSAARRVQPGKRLLVRGPRERPTERGGCRGCAASRARVARVVGVGDVACGRARFSGLARDAGYQVLPLQRLGVGGAVLAEEGKEEYACGVTGGAFSVWESSTRVQPSRS
jgi:hypothetical protein